MSDYGSVHRFLLRNMISRGVLTIAEAKRILAGSNDDQNDLTIEDLVKEINDEIRPLQQTIKITTDELTEEQMLVFLSLGSDEATKSQGFFSATELEYFKLLLEQIMTTESRQVTGIHAINIVSSVRPALTKTDAQKLLDLWCRMKYLDKEQNNYALGIRTIHEFESYFRQNMPDTIEECCLCKQIVFRGYNCPACALAVHTRCLNKFLEKVQKWPCCKFDFELSQLERLNMESSRLAHTQRQDTMEDVTMVEATQNTTTEETQNIELTQDLIPEISQRVTRKRKRPE